jgi:predicted phosphodiesterase
MKIALISDPHANLPALEAVLEAVMNDACDAVVCGGDLVGYYAEPNEVCDRIREAGIPAIRGNHDAYVIGALAPRPDAADAYRVDWTRETLTGENRRWLEGLPAEMRFGGDDLRWDGLRLTLRHASPWDEETYLYPDSDRLDEIRLEAREILAVGHTHRPLLRRAGEGLLVNPGSVGQPRDCDPRPAYALLDTRSGTVERRRVEYDVAAYQARLRSRGWDPRVVEILSRTAPTRREVPAAPQREEAPASRKEAPAA